MTEILGGKWRKDNTQPTPSPWRYVEDDGSRDGIPGGNIIGSNGHVVASATSNVGGDYNQEQLAVDLRLAAAAPAMLEALEAVQTLLEQGQALDPEHDGEWIREAIAQASGEAVSA